MLKLREIRLLLLYSCFFILIALCFVTISIEKSTRNLLYKDLFLYDEEQCSAEYEIESVGDSYYFSQEISNITLSDFYLLKNGNFISTIAQSNQVLTIKIYNQEFQLQKQQKFQYSNLMTFKFACIDNHFMIASMSFYSSVVQLDIFSNDMTYHKTTHLDLDQLDMKLVTIDSLQIDQFSSDKFLIMLDGFNQTAYELFYYQVDFEGKMVESIKISVSEKPHIFKTYYSQDSGSILVVQI